MATCTRAHPLVAERALVNRAASRVSAIWLRSLARYCVARRRHSPSVPPSFHSGVAITALRSGAVLTGLATALGPGSRRYRVGAMLTLLRVLLSLACASLRHFSLPLCEAAFHRKSGGRRCARTSIVLGKREHDMRKFHSIAALCGDGLRPELRELFDRLAVDPNSELFVRHDGMLQSGPAPKSIEAPPVERALPKRVA